MGCHGGPILIVPTCYFIKILYARESVAGNDASQSLRLHQGCVREEHKPFRRDRDGWHRC